MHKNATYKIATVCVSGVSAVVVDRKPIPRGITGAVVEFIYDDDLWEGLTKKVAFRGSEEVEKIYDSDTVIFPAEVAHQKNVRVSVGVTGVSADGTEVIPTLWAELGSVRDSAYGDYPAPGEPVPPVWAQILVMIGTLANLNTEARENLVAAINEVVAMNEAQKGRYYTPEATQPEAGVMKIAFVPSEADMPALEPVTIPLPKGDPGEDGADGKDGTDGKTAYEYAKDGGYTGTEEEFAKKLAEEQTFEFTVTKGESGGCSSSANFDTISNAINAGKIVTCRLVVEDVMQTAGDKIFHLVRPGKYGNGFVFAHIQGDKTETIAFVSMGIMGTAITHNEYNLATTEYVDSQIPEVEDGFSPLAAIEPIDGGHRVTITDKDGAKTFDVMDGTDGQDGTSGADGQDGFSPTVDVSEIEGGHRITITDASGPKTVDVMDGKDGAGGTGGDSSGVETETVLSDNLLDKSLLTKGQVFYYGGSGYQLAASTYSHYGFIPLRGAGTYRTKFQQSVHSSTGTRIGLVNDDNVWVANATGTCGEVGEDANWVDFEFVVTEQHIAAGATKVAFDVYELFLGKTMIVKDREYPSEYIPYGYIEVATDSGKKQDNVLCGKTALFLGDSICAGTTVGTDSPYYNYGWGGLIGEANRMNWFNYGKNGGTITNRGADGTCISKIADTAIAEHPDADYVIFEGGCNDADQMKDAGLGEISSDYATFDTATFSGALEALILKLVTAYPQAKIGYVIPQKMYKGYADFTAKNHIHRKYFDRAVEICQKWGIPVVDVWNGSMLNPKLSTASVYYSDGIQHLTEAGYLAITPMIESWMRNMYTTGVPAVSGGSGGAPSWNGLTDKPDYLNPLIGATSDITPTQVVDAISAGKAVYLTHTSNTYGLINFNAVYYCPSFHAVIGSAIVMYNMEFLAVEVLGYTNDNSWRLYSALLTTQTDLKEEIPE